MPKQYPQKYAVALLACTPRLPRPAARAEVWGDGGRGMDGVEGVRGVNGASLTSPVAAVVATAVQRWEAGLLLCSTCK